VLRVFDGDGFLTRISAPGVGSGVEATIRFGFTDAPEMGQPGGREAKDFLSKLIDGQWLDLVLLMKMDTGRLIDGHGRLVAIPYLRQDRCEKGGIANRLISFARRPHRYRNVELEMVLNGWAWVLDRYEPDPRYFEALEDAQRNRRGIWAWSDNVHPWEFKKQRYRETRQTKRNASRQPNLMSDWDRGCGRDGCNGRLVERTGRFGTFYGCSEFPVCRYSCSPPE
jgi:micrococcal nuclease